MNDYEQMDTEQLIDLLKARDAEIAILSGSCQRLLAENFKLEKIVAEKIMAELGVDDTKIMLD